MKKKFSFINAVLIDIFVVYFLSGGVCFAGGGEVSETEKLRKEVFQLKKEVRELKDLLGMKQGLPPSSSSLGGQLKQANEWRYANSKVHLAGYADAGYVDEEKKDGTFKVGTFSPIFHFLYRDLALLESEVEFEVEDDGATEVNLEYLTVDLFLNDYMALIVGKFLSPIGQFRQNLHPSWINKLPSAPVGFAHGQAAPSDNLGIQLRGGFPAGGTRFNYALFVGNGPEFDSGEEEGGNDIDLTSFRSGGHNEEEESGGFSLDTSAVDANSNKVVGGRIGFLPIPNIEVGVSGIFGKASTAEGDRDYTVYGFDSTAQYKGAEFRGEYVRTSINNGLHDSEDFNLEAWYLQLAYRLPFLEKVEPVIRWGSYDLPEGVQFSQWTFGVNYWFSSNLVAKVAYDIDDNSGTEDANRFMAQLAYGF